MEKIFFELADSLYEGVYIVDKNRKIIFWNKAAEKITGYKADEVISRGCNENILKHVDENGKNLCETTCPMMSVIENEEKIEAYVYLHHKNGYRLRVKIKGIPIIEDNQLKAAVEVFIPILPSSDTEEDLISLALKDPMTKLFNRKGFEMIYPLRQREMLLLNYIPSVFVIDLNDFKKINDNYGHSVGDRVLISVADTIKNILRPHDIVVRWGGDEFVLVVFIRNFEEVEGICNRVAKIIQSVWIEHNGEIIKSTISIGGTILKKDEDILAAIDRADNLMYQAKKSGKNSAVIDI